MTFLLAVSLAVQVAAAVVAVRLTRITGRRAAWLLIATAIALMAVRRFMTLLQLVADDIELDPWPEVVALCISALMLAGIWRVAPLINAIRHAEREVRQVFESSPEAVVVADEQDSIAYVNVQALQLFGHTRNEMVGKDVEALMPERFREAHRTRRAKFHERPHRRTMGADAEMFALTKEGKEIPIELSVSHLMTARGPMIVSSIRDVTLQRESEKAIKESEGRYRSLLDDVLDSSSVGVAILDSDFRIVWVNQAYEAYFGLQRADVIGEHAPGLVRERLRFIFEDHAEFGDRVLRTYEDNTYLEHFECRVAAPHGQGKLWLEHRSQPIESGLYRGGRIEHYTDITERKMAEDRIRLFARIARNMQLGLFVFRLEDEADDRSLRLVSLNPEGSRLLGVASEQVMGKLVDEVFPGVRAKGVPRLFADVIRSNESVDVEDFHYGDENVHEDLWSFKAFPLPEQSVGVIFEKITDRKRKEQLVEHVAAGVAGETGDAFFHSLTEHLAKSLGTEFAFVGEFGDRKEDSIHTVSIWAHGTPADEFTYPLEGTPCSHVVGRRICCFPQGVQRQFPKDHWLVEKNIESYLGTPLFDSAGKPLGLIAVMGERPMEDGETATAVLRIFAARAAMELERRREANLLNP